MILIFTLLYYYKKGERSEPENFSEKIQMLHQICITIFTIDFSFTSLKSGGARLPCPPPPVPTAMYVNMQLIYVNMRLIKLHVKGRSQSFSFWIYFF